jgi:hypothetical protein
VVFGDLVLSCSGFSVLFSDGNEDVGYTGVLGCDGMGYLGLG